MTGKWGVSGATEHSEHCHGQFNWLHPKILAKSPNTNEHKLRDSLEINNLVTKAEYDKSIKVIHNVFVWNNKETSQLTTVLVELLVPM